jgi:hypothetical protein
MIQISTLCLNKAKAQTTAKHCKFGGLFALNSLQTMSQLFAFGFNEAGALRCASWRLATGPRESSTMSMHLNRVSVCVLVCCVCVVIVCVLSWTTWTSPPCP